LRFGCGCAHFLSFPLPLFIHSLSFPLRSSVPFPAFFPTVCRVSCFPSGCFEQRLFSGFPSRCRFFFCLPHWFNYYSWLLLHTLLMLQRFCGSYLLVVAGTVLSLLHLCGNALYDRASVYHIVRALPVLVWFNSFALWFVWRLDTITSDAAGPGVISGLFARPRHPALRLPVSCGLRQFCMVRALCRVATLPAGAGAVPLHFFCRLHQQHALQHPARPVCTDFFACLSAAAAAGWRTRYLVCVGNPLHCPYLVLLAAYSSVMDEGLKKLTRRVGCYEPPLPHCYVCVCYVHRRLCALVGLDVPAVTAQPLSNLYRA